MQNEIFDETAIFACMRASGARFLLIGRKALVAYGAPVMTADYDVWLHIDDIEAFNYALFPMDFASNWDSATAHARGRYVLEGGDRIDVLVARACSTPAGVALGFDEAFARSVSLGEGEGAVQLPCIADLITTKEWASRPKDIVDIAYLRALHKSGLP